LNKNQNVAFSKNPMSNFIQCISIVAGDESPDVQASDQDAM
jgi:hypothetical protein